MGGADAVFGVSGLQIIFLLKKVRVVSRKPRDANWGTERTLPCDCSSFLAQRRWLLPSAELSFPFREDKTYQENVKPQANGLLPRQEHAQNKAAYANRRRALDDSESKKRRRKRKWGCGSHL